MKKILIAIPTNKYIEPETFKSIYDLIVPQGYKTFFQFFYGYQVDQIRNLIADWGRHYDYLFSVDSDIVLPDDALVKLLAANKDIVSGLYIQRKPGEHILEIYEHPVYMDRGVIKTDPSYRNMTTVPAQGLVEIAACGFGCVLVDSKVLNAMTYPHFLYQSALNHANTQSEDIYFCAKAKAHGFSIWADTTLVCEHIGQTKFVVQQPTVKTHLEAVAEQDLLPAEHASYLKTMTCRPKVIYDIGACVLHWTRKAKLAWPRAHYILFDAAQSVEPFLKKSGESYYLGVLTDQDQKDITFYEDPENPGGNSYYKETTGHYTEQHAQTRQGWTLDTVVQYNKWPFPDLIKMDIQGAELDVLRGAEVCLNNCSDLIIEAQHVDYNEGAPKIDDLVEYLKTKGFNLVSNFCKGTVDGDYHFSKGQVVINTGNEINQTGLVNGIPNFTRLPN